VRVLASFIPLFKNQMSWMLLGMLLSVLTVLFGFALLSLSGWFISASSYVPLVAGLAWQFNYLLPASGVRFFSLFRIAGRYGERVVSHQATFRLLTDIRIWFYQKLEPLAPAHLMQYQTGDLLSRMVGDIDALDHLYLRVLVPTIVAILVSLIVLLFFACFSWQISIVILFAAVAAIFLLPLLFAFLGRTASKALTLHEAQLKASIVEFLQGMSVLALNSQGQHFLNQLAEKNQTLLLKQKKLSVFSGLSSALMILLMGLTVLTVVWFAVHLVNVNKLNGALIAMLALGTIAWFEAVNPLPKAYQYLGKTSASARRILDVVEQKPAVSFADKQTVALSGFAFQVRDIVFAYPGGNTVLNDFSLAVPEGEQLAITGYTGSGKSTIAHLLSRCWDVQAGFIELGGARLQQLTETQLRDTVAMLPQQPHIFNTSVRDNLLIANEAAVDSALWSALEQVGLREFVEKLPEGLDAWVGEQGKVLSGGQQKRLALARMFLTTAPVLILDEPTEGLDRVTEKKVFTSLQYWSRGKTMILISHNPRHINLMDRVVNLSTGNF
jgi:ATP-binding cassette, subfamily C, bacterial CydC